MDLKNTTIKTFEELLKKTNEPILGIFFGTWCSYCQKNIPEIITHFNEIKANYKIYLINVEESDQVWLEDGNNSWNLEKVPTFRFYKENNIIEEYVGPIKPKKLEMLVKKYLIKK
ncbi:thioredoxin family protein [Mycoplasmoides pirum]|uniref:thioredoxin family protein n=1 Tax=Mycoplasmoides pirum TaxID=2122 RepID=UPI00048A3B18|nr:thioredoxin family protein [Mycoplasmoides pirum]